MKESWFEARQQRAAFIHDLMEEKSSCFYESIPPASTELFLCMGTLEGMLPCMLTKSVCHARGLIPKSEHMCAFC